MADGSFDPCECIFNHEMAMRRLLSLLRSSQAACTDNECFQDGLSGPGQGDAGERDEVNMNAATKMIILLSAGSDNFMMMMIGWMLMAAMMYFLRPNSMRNNSTEGKPQGNQIPDTDKYDSMGDTKWIIVSGPGGSGQGPRDPPPSVS